MILYIYTKNNIFYNSHGKRIVINNNTILLY